MKEDQVDPKGLAHEEKIRQLEAEIVELREKLTVVVAEHCNLKSTGQGSLKRKVEGLEEQVKKTEEENVSLKKQVKELEGVLSLMVLKEYEENKQLKEEVADKDKRLKTAISDNNKLLKRLARREREMTNLKETIAIHEKSLAIHGEQIVLLSHIPEGEAEQSS